MSAVYFPGCEGESREIVVPLRCDCGHNFTAMATYELDTDTTIFQNVGNPCPTCGQEGWEVIRESEILVGG